jgi:hypothetical protein
MKANDKSLAGALAGALPSNQPPVDEARVLLEQVKCQRNVHYFAGRYLWIFNATDHAWVRFALWPAQRMALARMRHERLLVILKARQLGMSWLSLAYALWMVLYQAPATVLLFSLRETESVELLARLKEMYARLPAWLPMTTVRADAAKLWTLDNGSRVVAFSTRSGRSYTGSLAIVDEADYVPELATFLNAVKPTVDAGGKLFLVSTSDKRRPISPFKNLFRAALAGEEKAVGDYRSLFLPWYAMPGRTEAWYARTKAEMYAQRGAHDDFYAEYPATAEEALAPEQLDRRVPLDWLQGVMELLPALEAASCEPRAAGCGLPEAESESSGSSAFWPAVRAPLGAPQRAAIPALPGLAVYEPVVAGRSYVVGADPAEGNPNSDDSAACVVDAASWAEVATLAGKFEPSVFASFIDRLATYYNHADAMVERNNHGHTVIAKLRDNGKTRLLTGYDGKVGWLSNVKGKPLLYDALAEAVRDGVCRVRSAETVAQLASIEASTLRAPHGLHDDRADAFGLAIVALAQGKYCAQPSTQVSPLDLLAGIDTQDW